MTNPHRSGFPPPALFEAVQLVAEIGPVVSRHLQFQHLTEQGDEFVLSADEKTSIQARPPQMPHPDG